MAKGRVSKVPDSQAAWDLEDAQLRLDNLALAIARKDELDLEVRTLRAKLRQAVRKAKEAQWDVGLLCKKERDAMARRAQARKDGE